MPLEVEKCGIITIGGLGLKEAEQFRSTNRRTLYGNNRTDPQMPSKLSLVMVGATTKKSQGTGFGFLAYKTRAGRKVI